MEGWWRRLRERLDEIAPAEMETWEDFLRRLRRTVTWMNEHWRDEGRVLCTNQHVRATEVRELHGAKCRF